MPGRAISRSRSQPLTPGEREKVTQTNVCIANKQMDDKHKDQVNKMLEGQKKHKVKEQGQDQSSVNYRATQNKNIIGTTAVERSIVYTTGGGGGKALYCTKFTLGPLIILNTKLHEKLGSHNGFLTQSMHLSENIKSNRSL